MYHLQNIRERVHWNISTEMELDYIRILFMILFVGTCTTGESDNCGANFTSPEGKFSHPATGDNYLKNQDCTWSITTTPGNRLVLSFTGFTLDISQSCKYDNVKIYDDTDLQSSPVRTHCGALMPEPYISTGHVLYITFHSNGWWGYAGFSLVWKVADTFAYINKLLKWTEAERWCQDSGGHLATFTPETLLSIKEVLPDKGDVGLWTGKYYTPWSWLKGCYTLPLNSTEFTYQRSTRFKMNQKKICVTHCNDSNYFALQNDTCLCFDNLHEGFEFVPTDAGCNVTCPGNDDERCGGHDSVTVYMNDLCWTNASEWTGTISRTIRGRTCQKWSVDTPNAHGYHDDGDYSDGSVDAASNYCRNPNGGGTPWCYTTDTNKQWDYCDVPLCFNTLYNVDKYSCAVVQKSSNSGAIGVYQRSCGVKHAYFCDFKDGDMLTTYRTLTWHASRDMCRGDFKGSFDFRDSFTFGNVRVMFGSWDDDAYRWIGYSRNTTDVVETAFVSDLTATDCAIMSRNGKRISEEDVSCQEQRTFVCQYTTIVCGENITDESGGNITSPGYPGDYGANLYCLWTISVDNSSVIMMDFIDIQLEESIKCYSDFIQIHDESKENMNNTFGRLCGNYNDTIQIVSCGNVIKVEFRSDSTGAGRGFSATWSSVPIPTTTDLSTVIMKHTSTTAANAMSSVKTNIKDNDTHNGAADGVYALLTGVSLLAAALVVLAIVCWKRRNIRMSMKAEENMACYNPNAHSHAQSSVDGDIPVYDNVLNCGRTNGADTSHKVILLPNIQSPDIQAQHRDTLESKISGLDELDDNIYDTTNTEDSEQYQQARSIENRNKHERNLTNQLDTNNEECNVDDYNKNEITSPNMQDEYDHTLSYQQASCFRKGITMERQSKNMDSACSHIDSASQDAENDYDYAETSDLSYDDLNSTCDEAASDNLTIHIQSSTAETTGNERDQTLLLRDRRQLDKYGSVYSHTIPDAETSYDHTLSYNQSRGLTLNGKPGQYGSLPRDAAQVADTDYDHTVCNESNENPMNIQSLTNESVYSHTTPVREDDYDHTLTYRQAVSTLSRNAELNKPDSMHTYNHSAQATDDDYDHTLAYTRDIALSDKSSGSIYNHTTKATENDYECTSSHSDISDVAGNTDIFDGTHDHITANVDNIYYNSCDVHRVTASEDADNSFQDK